LGFHKKREEGRLIVFFLDTSDKETSLLLLVDFGNLAKPH
jgi:hypothetical protein